MDSPLADAPPLVPPTEVATAPVDASALPPPSSPHRLRAVLFDYRNGELTVRRSVVAEGRAKAPPRTTSPYRLEFEVYDRRGELVYGGALDHPARQWGEAVDANGRYSGAEQLTREAAVYLRWPADVAAERVAFFEVKPPSSERRALSVVQLGE
jgi:hypothetical protein